MSTAVRNISITHGKYVSHIDKDDARSYSVFGPGSIFTLVSNSNKNLVEMLHSFLTAVHSNQTGSDDLCILYAVGTASWPKASVTQRGFVHVRMWVTAMLRPRGSADLLFRKMSSAWLSCLTEVSTAAACSARKEPSLTSHPAFVLPLWGMLMIVQIFAQNFLFRYCWKLCQSGLHDQTMALFSYVLRLKLQRKHLWSSSVF